MARDDRLDTPAELPAEFKEWLKRYVEQGIGVLGSNVHAPHMAINNSYPWLVDVDVFMTPISHTNWNTNTFGGGEGTGRKGSTGAQNAAISFDVVLAAGTWTFELMHVEDTDRGIYTVALGGTDIGTIDGYNALGAVYNVLDSITSVNVREPVKQRLTLTMKTKNAGSSSYVGSIQHIQFRRTA